jgi:hypothetical protein
MFGTHWWDSYWYRVSDAVGTSHVVYSPMFYQLLELVRMFSHLV